MELKGGYQVDPLPHLLQLNPLHGVESPSRLSFKIVA